MPLYHVCPKCRVPLHKCRCKIQEMQKTAAPVSLAKLRLLVMLWAGRHDPNALQCAKELTRVILPKLTEKECEEIESALTTHRLVDPVTTWIPASERLPDEDTPVLVVRNGEVRLGVIYWERPTWEEEFGPFKYWDDPNDDGQDWDFDSVTHWMPLPALP